MYQSGSHNFSRNYVNYSEDQIEKIGNTIVFLVENISSLSKTKILKLLYLLDEFSVRRNGVPFLNLDYKVWKYGPVAVDIFAELTSSPTFLKEYIERVDDTIKTKRPFRDDEFTRSDLELLEVVKRVGNKFNANELVKITHDEQTLWYKSAKENGVLDDLLQERINSTDFRINLRDLIIHDPWKLAVYDEFKENN